VRNEGLLTPAPLDGPIELTELDVWHCYGRTAKHGAFMGGARVRAVARKRRGEASDRARSQRGRAEGGEEREAMKFLARVAPRRAAHVFAVANIAFLGVDISLAHMENAFARRLESAPIVFSAVATALPSPESRHHLRGRGRHAEHSSARDRDP